MTDDEIVDAVKDKYDIPLATGVYYKAHLDLVQMGREAERERWQGYINKTYDKAYWAGIEDGKRAERKKIVAWLRDREQYGYAGYPAVAIETGEHLK